MSPARKVYAKKRRRQTRKWIYAVSVPLLVALLVAVGYIWYPRTSANSLNSQPEAATTPTPTINEPSPYTTFIDHYLAVMQNLNSTQTKAKMAPLLNPNFNQTDLFSWEKTKMTFASDPTGFFEDPTQILNRGMGICVQWSIVYVSACLALGYQSRLVVAVDTSSWTYIHTWAEDFYHGTWVHVDPSDAVWNNPSRYQSWDWGKYIGSEVKIYAFEDGTFQDVTATYAAPSS